MLSTKLMDLSPNMAKMITMAPKKKPMSRRKGVRGTGNCRIRQASHGVQKYRVTNWRYDGNSAHNHSKDKHGRPKKFPECEAAGFAVAKSGKRRKYVGCPIPKCSKGDP